MSFQGPISVNQVQPAQGQDLSLRVNERITIRVLEVNPTQAILDFNGYPVVARLTSRDQAAQLLNRRAADFIITQISPDQIQLKLVNKTGNGEGNAIKLEMKDLALELARSIGLKGNPAEIEVIRAALKENLPVTAQLVTDLLEIVRQSGLDTADGILLAVRLKAAGLPLNAESLQLVARFQAVSTAASFTGLISQLRSVLPGLAADSPMAVQVQAALAQLEGITPNLSTSPEDLSVVLQRLFHFIGKPYERSLKEQIQMSPQEGESKMTLSTLLQLSKELKQAGNIEVSGSIDHFLEKLREGQFMNIKPDQMPGKGQWAEVNFMVKLPQGEAVLYHDAKARVSYRRGKAGKVIDPGFTNLVLQVDLEPDREVQFSLSLFQKKISAEISSSDQQLLGVFSRSLPEFEQLLERLGYSVLKADTHLRVQETASRLDANLDEDASSSILDIEV